MKAALEPDSLLSRCGAGSGWRVPAFVSLEANPPPAPTRVSPAAKSLGRHPRGRRPAAGAALPAAALGAPRPRRCRPRPDARIPPEREPGASAFPGARGRAALQAPGGAGPADRPGVRGKPGTDPLGRRPGPRERRVPSTPAPPAPKLCGQRCSSGPRIPRGAHLLRPRALPSPRSPASPRSAPAGPGLLPEGPADCRAHCLIPPSPRPWVPDVCGCLRDRWCFGSLRGRKSNGWVARSLHVCLAISL